MKKDASISEPNQIFEQIVNLQEEDLLLYVSPTGKVTKFWLEPRSVPDSETTSCKNCMFQLYCTTEQHMCNGEFQYKARSFDKIFLTPQINIPVGKLLKEAKRLVKSKGEISLLMNENKGRRQKPKLSDRYYFDSNELMHQVNQQALSIKSLSSIKSKQLKSLIHLILG